ncbi:acetyltransferase (GNAT) family protein [Gillisia sp. Hel_I_86]|uniref:GNAT family N-acetyltransferase n=1 Tax=Gillisia sp. Hel_I_86 TaxID=1249981 RepID=UPI001199D55D|nr:GNAT family N-acetyltransferase [Gillisia sp. Hel_I_86]TVZ26112.1 acetyltransferase (GNAT) family protein [Gillisia sp. Hel_I_86]
MILANTAFLNSQEKQAVFKLWNQEYPKSLGYSKLEEFDSYLHGLSELHHVLVKDGFGNIVAWYSGFKREDGIWFAMILNASIQGKGIGTKLLEMAKQSNPLLNGWLIDHTNYLKNDGSIYRSPLKFYLRNDFFVLKQERLELPTISAVKIRWMALKQD